MNSNKVNASVSLVVGMCLVLGASTVNATDGTDSGRWTAGTLMNVVEGALRSEPVQGMLYDSFRPDEDTGEAAYAFQSITLSVDSTKEGEVACAMSIRDAKSRGLQVEPVRLKIEIKRANGSLATPIDYMIRQKDSHRVALCTDYAGNSEF